MYSTGFAARLPWEAVQLERPKMTIVPASATAISVRCLFAKNSPAASTGITATARETLESRADPQERDDERSCERRVAWSPEEANGQGRRSTRPRS